MKTQGLIHACLTFSVATVPVLHNFGNKCTFLSYKNLILGDKNPNFLPILENNVPDTLVMEAKVPSPSSYVIN